MIGTEERSGKFECTAARGENHGVVHAEGDHFQYQDGSTYIPVGTTCYAWIHQTEELQEETLDTLAESPFNKIRMCVFPKSMPYNNNEPDCYPFLKKEDGSWEVNDPDPVFWEKLDKRIKQLMELGIEADLILFHPYDRWGFSNSHRWNRAFIWSTVLLVCLHIETSGGVLQTSMKFCTKSLWKTGMNMGKY